jgi:FkbM family methyltransferase
MSSNFFSELGQDKFIFENFFPTKEKGFFIELGATDGKFNSNTYFFEKERNWKGLLIEPIEWYFTHGNLEKNRPNSICCNVAINDEEGFQDFFLIREDFIPYQYNTGFQGGHSGLNKYYDDQQRQRVNSLPCERTLIKVKCFPLQKLLDKYEIKYVDYLSVDVEGGEFAVLNSIDFSKVKIDVISVEDHWHNETIDKVKKLLFENNFEIVKLLGHDIIFKNKSTHSAARQAPSVLELRSSAAHDLWGCPEGTPP